MSAILANQLSVIRCESRALDTMPYSAHNELARIEDSIAISKSESRKLRLVRRWAGVFSGLFVFKIRNNLVEEEVHGRKKGATKTTKNGNRRRRPRLDD